MADAITNDYLQKILLPRNYKLDSSQDQITFWKRVSNKDTRTKFAFTMITVTKHVHSLRLEGINELRLQNEIKAGKIVLEDEDDFFNYFETVFETTLDSTDRFDKILDFFELQLHSLENMPNYSDEYRAAIDNIELLVEMANKTDLEE
jgi:hypothetical protein